MRLHLREMKNDLFHKWSMFIYYWNNDRIFSGVSIIMWMIVYFVVQYKKSAFDILFDNILTSHLETYNFLTSILKEKNNILSLVSFIYKFFIKLNNTFLQEMMFVFKIVSVFYDGLSNIIILKLLKTLSIVFAVDNNA
jgi:hypothetical protein